MNLINAQSLKEQKEVGIRKKHWSTNPACNAKFLTESGLISSLAFVCLGK